MDFENSLSKYAPNENYFLKLFNEGDCSLKTSLTLTFPSLNVPRILFL